MKEATMNVLYEKVRKHRGAMNAIANRVGRSREWVRRVLKGEYEDYNVITAALDEIQEREAKVRQIQYRLNSIAATATM